MTDTSLMQLLQIGECSWTPTFACALTGFTQVQVSIASVLCSIHPHLCGALSVGLVFA